MFKLSETKPAVQPSRPQHEAERACGHDRHHGTCPCCQRVQLARWHSQLVTAERRAATCV